MTTLFDAIETQEGPKLREPWPHQVRSIEGICEAAARAGQKRIMLQLPTGAGKTDVATRIFHRAIARRAATSCSLARRSISQTNHTAFSALPESTTSALCRAIIL